MSHLEAEHNLDSFREKPEEVDIYLLCVNFANDFQPTASFKDQRYRGASRRLSKAQAT